MTMNTYDVSPKKSGVFTLTATDPATGITGTSNDITATPGAAAHFEVDAPPAPEDLHTGEIPVAFFPPFHKYIYEESAVGSTVFILRQDIHT